MRKLLSLLTFAASLAGCSTPDLQDLAVEPSPEQNSTSEIEAAEGIGCNSIARMADETSSLFNYNLLTGERGRETLERIEDFYAPLVTLTAILQTFEEEIGGSDLLTSLADTRDSAEAAYQWAQDFVEADQKGRMREISDVAVYGAPLALWNIDLRVTHSLCVQAGHLEPDTELSSSDKVEALLDYGFWSFGTKIDDLGGVTLAWFSPTTTSDRQAKALVGLLEACEPVYGLTLSPMALSLEEQDYEPVAVGRGEQAVEMSIDGVRQTWATEVSGRGITWGLYPIERSQEFRGGTDVERSRILETSLLYLASAENVGLRTSYEDGQYSGQVSMLGIEAVIEKLRESGCFIQ